MIGDDQEHDQFISDHRWASLTTLRRNGNPSTSLVAYARDGDEIVISTPGGTFKRSSIERDPRVSLCVISNQEHFNFVTIEGTATIESEDILADTEKVFANIEASGYPKPPNLPEWLEKQHRVIIRIKPERVSGVIR